MSTLRSTRASVCWSINFLAALLAAAAAIVPPGPLHSITATTSPGPTASPAVTLISVTVPAFSAVTAFSIFMASSTQTVWPTSTVSPTATTIFTIVPCIGTMTVPDPVPVSDARRRAGALVLAGFSEMAPSGTLTFTS